MFPPEDRWCSILPDDPCEHKYLEAGIKGFVCAVCGETMRIFLPGQSEDDPPTDT